MNYYNPVTNTFSGTTLNPPKLGQVMWHITNQCNLNCSICFTKKMRMSTEQMLEKKDIQNYVKMLGELGVEKVDLSGGEPLLYPYLQELVSTCADNSIFTTITTSGFGTDSNINWLVENGHRFSRIIISLDGSKQLHNSLRGSTKAFDAFLRIYRDLERRQASCIRINTVVTQALLQKSERTSLANLIGELKPLEWCLVQPYPINKTDQFDAMKVSDEDFRTFVNACKAEPLLSDLHIECRSNADYGAYWSIFCDGFLYYSSNQESYDIKIEFTQKNLEKIKNYVMRHPQTYISLK